MSNGEFRPVIPTEEKPQLAVIIGDGPAIWTRSPLDFNVDTPIAAANFVGSNLMRKLQTHDKTQISLVHGKSVETFIPKTSSSAIVAEVYRRCLPKESRQLALDLENQAAEEEMAYITEGFISDPEYTDYLVSVVDDNKNSLLMQGFEVFSEAAWEFAGDRYEDIIREAQLFAAHLMAIQPAS